MAGQWVAGAAEAEADQAPVRLFCFAHAGGGAGFFQPWRAALRSEVDVRPVLLPGRESRVRETPYTRAEDLLGPLTEALLPLTDKPYALFGHSMGSVLAYETARRLTAVADRAPLCVFASGRRAPQLPRRHPPLHSLPEDDFLHGVSRLNGTPPEVLRQPELFRLFIPALRADFALNELYTPLPGPALGCPVSGLVGDADPEVDVDEMAAWRHTTEAGFTLRVFRGDHFYLKGRPAELLAAIAADLRRLLPAQATAAVHVSAQS